MIGVSCPGFSATPVAEWAGPISEHFRLWEIFSEADHIVYRDTPAIKGILDFAGLSRQVHSPICDWNIAALSDRLREASLKETVANIEAAEELGAKVVTVHPGLSSMSVPGTEERAMARARESLRALDRLVAGRDIRLGIENMPNVPFFLGRTAEGLGSLIEGTDLGVTFDIGHANTTGQIDAMIAAFADRLVNIHIHDNHGQRDEHLTISDGDIDFGYVVSRLRGYRGNWIIESKSLESAVQSLSRLEALLSRSGTQFGRSRTPSSERLRPISRSMRQRIPSTMTAMMKIAASVSVSGPASTPRKSVRKCIPMDTWMPYLTYA